MTFTFRLEWHDGTPADPPTLKTFVPNWSLDGLFRHVPRRVGFRR
jgi:hypothetical protein